MKQASGHLLELIEPIVAGLGYECVGIEYNPHPRHGLLRVYIDSEQGVQLEDCSKVSHQISGVLDVEDPIQGNYRLEISSPGMDRPLFKIAHFQQFTGRQATVNLFRPVESRKKITGTILGVEEETILLEDGGQVFRVPLQAVSKARLVPDYSVEKGEQDGNK